MPRPYVTLSGAKRIAPSMSDVDSAGSDRDVAGWCLVCGNLQLGVEPDAERYTCEDCGEGRVYGLEQLALMGLIRD